VINVNGGIQTTGSGGVAFVNSGALNINTNIVSDGAITQSGAGAVALNGARTLTTTGDAVSFAAAVTMAGGNLSIDTTVGGNTGGGSIQFSNTLTGGTNQVLLNAGTAGNVNLAGTASGITAFTVTNSGTANLVNVTTSGAVDVHQPGSDDPGNPEFLEAPSGWPSTTSPCPATSLHQQQYSADPPGGYHARHQPWSGSGLDLVLDTNELSRIHTSGLLTIGDISHTGAININSGIANPSFATAGSRW